MQGWSANSGKLWLIARTNDSWCVWTVPVPCPKRLWHAVTRASIAGRLPTFLAAFWSPLGCHSWPLIARTMALDLGLERGSLHVGTQQDSCPIVCWTPSSQESQFTLGRSATAETLDAMDIQQGETHPGGRGEARHWMGITAPCQRGQGFSCAFNDQGWCDGLRAWFTSRANFWLWSSGATRTSTVESFVDSSISGGNCEGKDQSHRWCLQSSWKRRRPRLAQTTIRGLNLLNCCWLFCDIFVIFWAPAAPS